MDDLIADEAAGRLAGSARWRGSVLLMLTLFLGCRTFDVHSDWDREREFDDVKRFSFMEPAAIPFSDPFADNTLLRKRVRGAIERTLIERGFSFVDEASEADLLVTYHVTLEERLRVDGVSSTSGLGYYDRPLGVGVAQTNASVRPYQESTLIIDFLDPSSRDLVWRGWGTGLLGTRSRDRSPERLEKGLTAILERYPPARATGAGRP
jgi:hypothetical protein